MWLAEDPAKRWMERFVLGYSVVWIAAIAAVQVTRVFTRWGDLGHLALGVGAALPLWLVPLLRPPPSERGRPLAARHSLRFNLWIGLFSLLQVYFGSALFFDVLGMQYHFNVRWVINRTPLFLYPLTIAYFSTYYVVMSIVWRAFRARFATAPTGILLLARALLAYSVAFAETASMANDLLKDYFSYSNKAFVLGYGSVCYGTVFFVSLPFVFGLDEDSRVPAPSLRRIVWDVLAVNMIVLVLYEIYTALLGPSTP
jgi:cycloeucalenol cycloisomerase